MNCSSGSTRSRHTGSAIRGRTYTIRSRPEPGNQLTVGRVLDDALCGPRALLVALARIDIEVQEHGIQSQILVEPTPSARAEHLRGLRGEPQRSRNRHVRLGFL